MAIAFALAQQELMATEPRLPCYKLGLRFRRDDIVKRFLESGRTGMYFAVTLEGEVGAGDAPSSGFTRTTGGFCLDSS